MHSLLSLSQNTLEIPRIYGYQNLLSSQDGSHTAPKVHSMQYLATAGTVIVHSHLQIVHTVGSVRSKAQLSL